MLVKIYFLDWLGFLIVTHDQINLFGEWQSGHWWTGFPLCGLHSHIVRLDSIRSPVHYRSLFWPSVILCTLIISSMSRSLFRLTSLVWLIWIISYFVNKFTLLTFYIFFSCASLIYFSLSFDMVSDVLIDFNFTFTRLRRLLTPLVCKCQCQCQLFNLSSVGFVKTTISLRDFPFCMIFLILSFSCGVNCDVFCPGACFIFRIILFYYFFSPSFVVFYLIHILL